MIQLTDWQYGVIFGICITLLTRQLVKGIIFMFKVMKKTMPEEMKDVFRGMKDIL